VSTRIALAARLDAAEVRDAVVNRATALPVHPLRHEAVRVGLEWNMRFATDLVTRVAEHAAARGGEARQRRADSIGLAARM